MNKSKNLKAIILIFISVLFTSTFSFSQEEALSGDFGVINSSQIHKMEFKMIAISLPFEGLNTAKAPHIQYNRISEIQNGNIWKYFIGNSTYQVGNIFYNYALDSLSNMAYLLDLGHACGIEFPESNLDGIWGFALYKISVIMTNLQNNNVERYSFILNSLDSYLGDTLHTPYGDSIYKIGDFIINYDPTFPENNRLHVYSNYGGFHSIDTINTADTLANGFPKTEIKLWEIIRGYNQPVAEDFFARTTPFGLRPEIIDSMNVNEIFLGTKVILDKVYNNSGATDRYGYNTRNDGDYYYYYSNPPVAVNEPGRTYVTPSIYNSQTEKCLKIILLNNNKITLDTNKKLWISGNQTYNKGDEIFFSKNSQLTMKENSEINTFRFGKLTDSGSVKEFHPNSIIRAYENTDISFIGNQENHTINNSALVEIKGNARLNLGNSTTVTFDGAGTRLELLPGAIVKLGQNAKILFKNGARLVANGANFSGINGAIWQGIVFENPGSQNVISNCTFNNALIPLKFSNNENGVNSSVTISGNTFNILNTTQSSNQYGIYTLNLFKANITGNTVNINNHQSYYNTSVYMKNTFVPGPPPDEGEPYDLKITNNNINGGKAGIILAGYATELVPYYIYGNKFNPSSNYTSVYGLIARKINGNIKNSTFYGGRTVNNINVTESHINVLNNTLSASGHNLYLNSNSTANLNAIKGDNDFILYGGENIISSTGSTNIYVSFCRLKLENGFNCFYGHGTGYYYLNGKIDTTVNTYHAEQNHWNNLPPEFFLLNRYDSVMNILYQPVHNCNYSLQKTVYDIVDKGDGIYDTIYKIPDNTGIPPSPADVFYNQAQAYINNDDYPSAIINFKSLIDGYPSSSHLPGVLYELYSAYEMLDTSDSQSYRDNLYSDCKNYLTAKINSNNYDYQFNDIAYSIILMCEGNMMNYNEALTGYEFLAMYHPDAVIRLMASWDYAEIEALLGGGGSYREESIGKHRRKALNRLENAIIKDTLMKKMSSEYKRTIKENEKDLKNKYSKSGEKEKIILDYNKQREQLIRDKAVRNMMISKTLNEEQRSEKQIEDIFLINNKHQINQKDGDNSLLPKEYSLSQNYPNPFNPVTKISYAIPKQGLVTLKVYDILGREVRTLVNEVKAIGKYTIDFDGTDLSSGVYFYRIKAGDFVNTKRMVLIK